MQKTIAILIASLLLCSCNLIYQADIQQGNILDQKLVDQLRPGMTKRQVSLILGTPAIEDPFHRNQWDYVNTFERRGLVIDRKLLSLSFEQDRLVRIEGDYAPGKNDEKEDDTNNSDA